MSTSIDEGYHLCSALRLLGPKLLRIPLLRAIGCDTEVDRNKDQGAEHCQIQDMAFGSCHYCDRRVDQTLGKIVRSERYVPRRMIRHTVRTGTLSSSLERGQIRMAVVLEARGQNEDQKANECAETGRRKCYVL